MELTVTAREENDRVVVSNLEVGTPTGCHKINVRGNYKINRRGKQKNYFFYTKLYLFIFSFWYLNF